jgi:hypothetical protein
MSKNAIVAELADDAAERDVSVVIDGGGTRLPPR